MLTSIYTIIVTYNPSIESLISLVTTISQSSSKIILIDNNSKNINHIDKLSGSLEKIIIIKNNENRGLAYAQNQGITIANQEDATHVILFDQDSLPESNMLVELLNAERDLLKNDYKVAAVGPSCFDRNKEKELPFIQQTLFQNKKIYGSTNKTSITRADFLIASGCLIRTSILKEVGLMDEHLFIDNIDLEWCYRAKSHGYNCYGNFNAKLNHNIGDSFQVILGREYTIHSPFRLYYITRNRVLMYKKKYIPTSWVIHDIPRLVLKSLIFCLFIKPRVAYFFAILNGLIDAIKNKKEL